MAHCRLPVPPTALKGQPRTLLLSSMPTAMGWVSCHLPTEACILFHFSPRLPRHVFPAEHPGYELFFFFWGLPAHWSLCCCAGQQPLHVRAGGAWKGWGRGNVTTRRLLSPCLLQRWLISTAAVPGPFCQAMVGQHADKCPGTKRVLFKNTN